MDEKRFLQLLLDKLSRPLSTAEEEELRALLLLDEGYAKQYRLFIEYWETNKTDTSNSQRLFEKLSTQIRMNEPDFQQEPRKYNWHTKKLLIAATALFFLTLSMLSLLKQVPTNRSSRVSSTNKPVNTSQASGIRRLTLEDGSVIKLNRNSSISGIRMLGQSREVTLTGEGFFDIKRDVSRPFTIHTTKMDIRVLGTSFNVCAYPNERRQQAVLIHGSIKVTLHDKSRSVFYLKPNDKLTIHTDKDFDDPAIAPQNKYRLSRLKLYDEGDTTAVVETAWTSNQLVFRDESFEILAHRLEQRYGIPIEFKSEKAKQLHFNGTFKTESLQEVLYILSRTGNPFSFTFKDQKVLIN
jgi:transmembrane sensor